MKKLLLLGGSRYLLPVIEAAHKCGVYVITCDYLPDNIAHRYSDEYHNISIIEKETVLSLAANLKIDGIMSFACDPGVVTAAYVAEKLGLPSCGPYESVRILQNKGLFRKFLAENAFTVPTAKSYHTVEDVLADAEIFHWPVVVKPVDSAGSKGVSRLSNPAELPSAVSLARAYSHCGEFIVEDFIQQRGYSSDTDCFSINGKLAFVSFSSQYFDEDAANPYTPAGFSWPASLSEAQQKELSFELQRLLALLHMKTTIYNVETRVGTDGKAYIMEVSPRGGGNRLAEMLHYATGVDLITNAVRAAIGDPVELQPAAYSGHWAEIILHSDIPGIFETLWIANSIESNVVERDVWVQPGERIGGFSGANEAIGTLVLQFETVERMNAVMNHVKEYVKIIVRNAKDLGGGGTLLSK